MSDLAGSEPSRGGGRATPLWVGAVVLAAAATAVLVLSDDSRLLKLALVAALWAALLSAFAVAELRGRAADGEQRAAELQRVYQQELEREVAARREFEAEAEAAAHRRAAEDSAQELQALRAELNNLRQALEQVVGGDVLFERVALRAESTRMRSLVEQGGAMGSAARLHPVDERGGGRGDVQVGPAPAERASQNPLASNPAVPNPAAAFPAAPNRAGPNPVPPDARIPNPMASDPASAPRMSPPTAAAAGEAGTSETGRPADEQVSEQRTEMFPRVSGQQEQPRSAAPGSDGTDAPSNGAAPARWFGGDEARGSSGAPVDPVPSWASRTGTDFAPPAERSGAGAAAPANPDAPADRSEEQRSAQVGAGAHAEGTSVTELLAAYGESNESQRRRRRRD